ncbi:hypothetical protein C8Q78DRAFT_1078051 [Trametes maxima]|nr:hypothetical protein C8Q78DRAFT_1078051 [Trametes maxima]
MTHRDIWDGLNNSSQSDITSTESESASSLDSITAVASQRWKSAPSLNAIIFLLAERLPAFPQVTTLDIRLFMTRECVKVSGWLTLFNVISSITSFRIACPCGTIGNPSVEEIGLLNALSQPTTCPVLQQLSITWLGRPARPTPQVDSSRGTEITRFQRILIFRTIGILGRREANKQRLSHLVVQFHKQDFQEEPIDDQWIQQMKELIPMGYKLKIEYDPPKILAEYAGEITTPSAAAPSDPSSSQFMKGQ